jgi:hypothetical protein
VTEPPKIISYYRLILSTWPLSNNKELLSRFCRVKPGESLTTGSRYALSPHEGGTRIQHYITLHYITLHYITLHYITLHYITLAEMLVRCNGRTCFSHHRWRTSCVVTLPPRRTCVILTLSALPEPHRCCLLDLAFHNCIVIAIAHAPSCPCQLSSVYFVIPPP